jgi:GNAT superfamily N-acetyltransferase
MSRDPAPASPAMNVAVRCLAHSDIAPIVAAFAAVAWPGKERAQYERYLAEQSAGERLVLVATADDGFAGYLCVQWRSGYAPFRAAGIPEIVDFNVLPAHRRRGIGTALMDAAEREIATRSATAGVGCGLYADYGPALLLYLSRGYRPDARGIAYAGRTVAPGATIRIDDAAALMLTKRVRGA